MIATVAEGTPSTDSPDDLGRTLIQLRAEGTAGGDRDRAGPTWPVGLHPRQQGSSTAACCSSAPWPSSPTSSASTTTRPVTTGKGGPTGGNLGADDDVQGVDGQPTQIGFIYEALSFGRTSSNRAAADTFRDRVVTFQRVRSSHVVAASQAATGLSRPPLRSVSCRDRSSPSTRPSGND